MVFNGKFSDPPPLPYPSFLEQCSFTIKQRKRSGPVPFNDDIFRDDQNYLGGGPEEEVFVKSNGKQRSKDGKFR